MTTPAVMLENLAVTFGGRVRAVDNVDLTLARGQVVALIGESGSGKSVTLRAIMRLNPERASRVEGSIRVAGRDVMALSKRELSAFRGRQVAMIFQEPLLALDPVYTVGAQRALGLFERVRIRARSGGSMPTRTRCRAACASAP